MSLVTVVMYYNIVQYLWVFLKLGFDEVRSSKFSIIVFIKDHLLQVRKRDFTVNETMNFFNFLSVLFDISFDAKYLTLAYLYLFTHYPLLVILKVQKPIVFSCINNYLYDIIFLQTKLL